VRGKERDLREQAQSLRDVGLDRKIAVVEWNYWTRAGHNDHAEFYEPNDIRHCLYAAGYMNAFCRMGDILEIANYYSLVNTMGMIRVKDGQLEITDVAKVFQLFKPALPGEVLKVETNNDMLDANFIRSGDTIYGFLINFSHDSTLRVDLGDLGPVKEATGISADAILKPVDEIVPKFDTGTVELPPASFVRVTCKQ
jgi:alpha-L-arabinofuranosidase